MERNIYKIGKELFITSDEEIKESDYAYYMAGFMVQRVKLGVNVSTLKAHKKIILTTDLDLIKDGIQAINDDFLEWFVENPSCEEVEVINWFGGMYPVKYKIIIPKEEPKQKLPIINGSYGCTIETDKQETLEDFIKRESKSANESVGIVKGSKWQQEQDKNKYSEEEVFEIVLKSKTECYLLTNDETKEWFKKFKKK